MTADGAKTSAALKMFAVRLKKILARHGWRILAASFILIWAMRIVFIVAEDHHTRDQAIRANLQAYDTETSAKAREISSLFADLHAATRTISLLPAVRQVKPQNRRNKFEDVVAEGRFNRFDSNTVQQLYNHISSQISVSEIYLVYRGFDPGRGQVPFIAFDQAILDTFQKNLKERHIKRADAPEEDESSEYLFFDNQLRAYQAQQPQMPKNALKDVRGVFSGLMRTCDNSQYISKSQGNERDAWGLSYTVPVFDYDSDQLSGMVATVILANTLEARLIGWPRLPILASDIAELRRLQYDLTTPPVEYMLENASLGIRIYDRRNRDIPGYLANTLQPAAHLQKTVTAASNGKWVLHRWIARTLPETVQTEMNRALWWRIGGASGLMLSLWYGVIWLVAVQRRSTEEERDRMISVVEASLDLVGMVDPDGNLLFLNRGGRMMIGLGERALKGLHLTDIHPQWAFEKILHQGIPAALREGSWMGETALVNLHEGREVPVSQIILPHYDEQGKLRYLSTVMRDISERKETEKQLQQLNEALEQRVEQRTAALKTAMDEAERANHAKSEFLASMSHELRTPMNAVLGFAQLMEVDEKLSEDNRDNVREILKAGRHLLELISEVLNLAKIESGKIKLSMEPVRLCDVIDECLALVQSQAQAFHIQIEKDDCQKTVLWADRLRFKQVLLNLLSNAVKYNRPNGRVRLHFSHEKERLSRILISDTGPGIAPERLDEVFQPFNRLGAEGGAIEGTGIGLTISRQLIELMGGTVGVESTVGVGSTFWVELPQERRQVARQEGHAPPAVLYIDDNPGNLKILSRLLGQRPHLHVKTAHTTIAGIELATANIFNLIFLNVNMSGMDGFDAVTQLRKQSLSGSSMIVALTTDIQSEDRERFLSAGFNECLVQPVEAEALFKIVDLHIPSRREMK